MSRAHEIAELRIKVVRQTPGWPPYAATSPDWPGLIGCGGEAIANAVASLMLEVEGSMPLGAATVEALIAVGGDDAVAAWDRHVRGAAHVHLRDCGERAGALLREFLASGHSLERACAWAGVGVGRWGAISLECASMDPASFWTYAERYELETDDLKWWEVAPRAVDWAAAGIPMERASTYAHHGVSIVDAAESWEPLVARTLMPTDRLSLYLRLEISAGEAAQHERSILDGVDVVAALNTLRALQCKPRRSSRSSK